MKPGDIYVKDGSVTGIENIIETEGKWRFINNDPQIIVRFDRSVRGVRIELDCEEDFSSDGVEIFYRADGNAFEEERKIRFCRTFGKDSVTDVIFDSEYNWVRIDLSGENVSCALSGFKIYPLSETSLFVNGMETNFSAVGEDAFLVVSFLKDADAADEIVRTLAGNGRAADKVFLNEFSGLKYDFYGFIPVNKFDSFTDMKRNLMWEAARNAGIKNAIVCGECSRQQIREIKDYGFVIAAVCGAVSEKEGIADYADYVVRPGEDIEARLKEGLRIKPDLDVYRYQNSSFPHYFERQNKYGYEQKQAALKKAGRGSIFRKRPDPSKIALLDTAIGSDNAGDDIIMSYCGDICAELFAGKDVIHIPTHIYDGKMETIEDCVKILCGTNLIYKRMEDSRQMVLPYNLKALKNTCLLGVGMQQLGMESEPSKFTVDLLKMMLDNKFTHSVRDAQTESFLKSIGIKNVINTNCPTMWGLTKEHCAKIPASKSGSVLTTITDYAPDPEADAFMLGTLLNEYENVYLWVQGQCDYLYLQKIINCRRLTLIPPTLDGLDAFLERNKTCDYIGTRLHAGIRCLNKLHRSLVIAVDNRARAIHEDTGLPVMERADMADRLANWINCPQKTEINLNFEKINIWKAQFSK